MNLRLFLIGAIVLIVFAIIAFAGDSDTCLGVPGLVWVGASLLSFYTDILTGWGFTVGNSRPPT